MVYIAIVISIGEVCTMSYESFRVEVELHNILSSLDEAWYGWFRWNLELAGIKIPDYENRPPPFEPIDHSWIVFEKIR